MMDETIQLDASEHVETYEYPRKTNITMENHIFFGGKSTIEGTYDRKQNPTRNSGTLLYAIVTEANLSGPPWGQEQ